MEQDERNLEQKYLASFLQDVKIDIPELENAIRTDGM